MKGYRICDYKQRYESDVRPVCESVSLVSFIEEAS